MLGAWIQYPQWVAGPSRQRVGNIPTVCRARRRARGLACSYAPRSRHFCPQCDSRRWRGGGPDTPRAGRHRGAGARLPRECRSCCHVGCAHVGCFPARQGEQGANTDRDTLARPPQLWSDRHRARQALQRVGGDLRRSVCVAASGSQADTVWWWRGSGWQQQSVRVDFVQPTPVRRQTCHPLQARWLLRRDDQGEPSDRLNRLSSHSMCCCRTCRSHAIK